MMLRETMVSAIILAVVGGLAATATTAVATGDASAAVNAAHAVPQGLQVALSHVPAASHAHEVLTQHLSLYAGTGSAGTAAGGGVAAAMKHGLHFGLGK